MKGRPNEDLFMKFGGASLPFIAVLDHDGKLLCKHEAKSRSLEAIEATYARGFEVNEALASLRVKVRSGDAKAAITLFERQLELQHLDSTVARLRLAALKSVSAAQRMRLGKIVDQVEFSEMFNSALLVDGDPVSVVSRYEALVARGSRPKLGSAGTFWYLYAQRAVEKADVKQVERGLEGLKQVLAWLDDKDPMKRRMPEAIKLYTAALKRLRH